jgi:dihydrofolate reductase
VRNLTYYIGTTLDGYAAGPGGEIDFYPVSEDHLAHMVEEYPEVLPTHVRAELGADGANRRFDAILMGRTTYAPAVEQGLTSPYSHLHQYVASTTMHHSPDPEVTIVTDALATVRELKQEDGLDIYLAGGGRLAGSVRDEIDELIVKVYPVLAGQGVSMFAGDFVPRRFDLTDQHSFSSGVVVLSYTRTDQG